MRRLRLQVDTATFSSDVEDDRTWIRTHECELAVLIRPHLDTPIGDDLATNVEDELRLRFHEDFVVELVF